MIKLFGLLRLASVILLIGTLSGCVSYLKFVESQDLLHPENSWLTSHRSPVVKYPALAGYYVGFCVGVPLIIPWDIVRFIPSVIVEGVELHNDPKVFEGKGDIETAVSYAPPIVLSVMGKYALGTPCWCLFGWWWPKPIVKEPTLPEKKMEQPSLGTEKSGTLSKMP